MTTEATRLMSNEMHSAGASLAANLREQLSAADAARTAAQKTVYEYQARIHQLESQLQSLEQTLEANSQQLISEKQRTDKALTDLRQAQELLRNVLCSRSWKITAWMRNLKQLLFRGLVLVTM